MRLFILFFVSLISINAYAASDVRVVRVTPTGDDVPPSQQIVIEFSRPIVPVGRMEREASEIPVTITPALNCQWRWLNTQSLSCNLDQADAMKVATAYAVEIAPGIKAEDGQTIAEAYKHQFITERPNERNNWFKEWRGPGTPVMIVNFNQQVTQDSARQHLYFAQGDERFAVEVEKDPDDQASDEEGGRYTWLVSPKDPLPLDSELVLKIEPGLVSVQGKEKGIAERDIVQLVTYPEFAFLGVRCRNNNNDEVLITPEAPQKPDQLCNPMESIYLSFNAPVFRSQLKQYFSLTPSWLGSAKKDAALWGEDDGQEYSRLSNPIDKGQTFNIWLPAGLKAAQEYTIALDNKHKSWWERLLAWFWPRVGLEDEFGRTLAEPVAVQIKTDHRKPNYEIIHNTAVLEKAVDSEVPLYVNNLTQAQFDYRSVTATQSLQNQRQDYTIPAVQDVQFAIPFDVKAMLKGKSGAVYGSLSTTPEVKKYEGANILFAQVTPYQIHAKLGHFSTVIWVTEFATGKPVIGANVGIYEDAITQLTLPTNWRAKAVTNEQGIVLLPGTVTLDPSLIISTQWKDSEPHLFIRAEKEGEIALLPVANEFAVYPGYTEGDYVYPDSQKEYGHMESWGTTAQGIYRAGDTIQYKFYVRNQNNTGLITPPLTGYQLEISDPTGKVVHKVKDITLSAFGGYDGEYTVPKQAAVGWYQFTLTFKPSKDTFTWQPMRVLVSDFTPSPFKVRNSLNGDVFTAGQVVQVATSAQLHSGGAYTQASARITTLLDERRFTSKDPIAKDFVFASYDRDYRGSQQIDQKITALDDKGELTHEVTLPESDVVYGTLRVESAVQDERGKYIAAQSQAHYVGVDRLVGLHSSEWLYPVKQEAAIDTIVVDETGKPVSGTPVSVTIEREVTQSARVKGAGNAYLTQYTTEWKKESDCNLSPDTKPLPCKFTPQEAGTYRMIASIKDTKGRSHSTELRLWVTGKDYVLWRGEDDSTLQVVPEKTEYRVGETARYLVKNPYPGAQALITVERYGVIDHFVQTLEGSTPVIEFPVKPDYLPGFYLSIVIQSPRVDGDKPLKMGELDLGKPTFRMAYLKVPVIDPYKELVITAKAEQDVYRPRDVVNVKLHAAPRMPMQTKEPIEFAVVVLDEAVFDLVAGGREYFDPYKGFARLDGLDVRNYSLLTRLVGRQKFEKKGANPGGDGGADLSMRDVFKFVAYWNPSLKADASGNAQIEFELPDNLTGWRVLAMAVTPNDRLGLGEGEFKVNRPTEVRPVMPNQVMEGDKFKAGFSVMNRTDHERTLQFNAHVTGQAEFTQDVVLKPYERSIVWIPVEDAKAGMIAFNATAKDNEDGDGMVHNLPVLKRISLLTAANYGTTTEDTINESILFPDHIRSDTGEVGITLAPSVISNIDGAFRYMRDYPYLCWEQRLTKAVMASQYKRLREYLPPELEWKDSASIPQQTLDGAADFQAPNGGMAYFLAQDGYVDPYLSAYTSLAFNWLRKDGYAVPEEVEKRLDNYLLNLLKHDTTPDFYQEGMRSSVRAVALAALAERGKVTRQDVERYQPAMKGMSLFGKAQYLAASLSTGVPGAQTGNAILAHANQTGGKFIFSETLDSGYTRILATPLRDNCAILDSFVTFAETPKGRELVGDVPFKLVRMITQARKSRDHWENTQENMFCMRALVHYSEVYEKETPRMALQATLGDEELGSAEFESRRDAPVTLSRPIAEGDSGRKATLTVTREGQGRLYYTSMLRYAPQDGFDTATNAGMEIRREYSVERDGEWVLLSNPAEIKRGELVRVDIYLSLPSARNFVVVNDPVPGGLEPVNRDLATTSIVDADKAVFKASGGSWWFKFKDWHEYGYSRWSFYHQELRHDSVRFYSDYLSAGNYHLSYAAQAIAEGDFAMLPVHAEEMYDPDVFAKGISATLRVAAGQ